MSRKRSNGAERKSKKKHARGTKEPFTADARLASDEGRCDDGERDVDSLATQSSSSASLSTLDSDQDTFAARSAPSRFVLFRDITDFKTMRAWIGTLNTLTSLPVNAVWTRERDSRLEAIAEFASIESAARYVDDVRPAWCREAVYTDRPHVLYSAPKPHDGWYEELQTETELTVSLMDCTRKAGIRRARLFWGIATVEFMDTSDEDPFDRTLQATLSIEDGRLTFSTPAQLRNFAAFVNRAARAMEVAGKREFEQTVTDAQLDLNAKVAGMWTDAVVKRGEFAPGFDLKTKVIYDRL